MFLKAVQDTDWEDLVAQLCLFTNLVIQYKTPPQSIQIVDTTCTFNGFHMLLGRGKFYFFVFIGGDS